MTFNDPQFAGALLELIEGLGTLAFAISGIRHAAEKHFDWFGGYVCGFAVAIGGGTIRYCHCLISGYNIKETYEETKQYMVCF